MNTSLAQEPFTRLEFAGGSIAVAAIVLIALLGLSLSRPQEPPPPAPSSASTGSSTNARQWHRTSGGATREAANQASNGSGTTRALPPTDALARPGSPIAPNPSGPTAPGPLASDQVIVGGARAVAAPPPPEIRGSMTPNLSLEQTPPAPEWWQSREAAIPSPPGAERNLADRSDALLIQSRLHELGYYSGNGNGAWGAASRNALHDFKSMNGLQDDDKWDKETEQRLLSRQSIPATSTFIGGWATDTATCPGRADTGAPNGTCANEGLWSALAFLQIGTRSRQCQSSRDGGAALVRISSRGAETAGAKCDFRSVRRATASRWQIQAVCSGHGQSWNANVRLRLDGPNLTWSSERGSIKYVRCQ